MRRSAKLFALVIVIAVASAGALGFFFRDDLRARWLARRLDSADANVRADAARRMIALGPAGVRALEAIAFAPDEIAEPTGARTEMRQTALDALWEHDTQTALEVVLSGNLFHIATVGDPPPARGPFPRARLALYLAGARGLSRPAAIVELDHATGRSVRDPALTDAAAMLVLTDPDRGVVFAAWRALAVGGRRALPTLRRVALESPEPLVRGDTLRIFQQEELRDPENVPTLHRALGDLDESVRIAAAATLARSHQDDAGLAVLVAALRKNGLGTDAKITAAIALGALGDPRTIEAVIRFEHESGWNLTPTIERLTRAQLRQYVDAPSWTRWWSVYRDRFPPQLDPETIAAKPIELDR